MLFYAGAGLAQHVRDELQELAVETTGERIIFMSSLGSTETAPAALACTWECERPAISACRCRASNSSSCRATVSLRRGCEGANITPGYWRAPALTADAFDEEGFYKIGDALKFADPADPAKGLLFDGRLAEDFKLATGTWVSVGPLRAAFIAHFAPLVRDVVLAGADRDEVAALVYSRSRRLPQACARSGGRCAAPPSCWPIRACGRNSRGCSRALAAASTRHLEPHRCAPSCSPSRPRSISAR